MSIEYATNGSLAKNKKLNEVIEALNSIINMSVREGANGEAPEFTFGQIQSSLITTGGITDNSFTGGDTGGGGGGIPNGYTPTLVNMCIDGEEEQVTLLIKFSE
jgi:hypothetical protein